MPDVLTEEEKAVARVGKKLEAIKLFRARTGSNLTIAKEAVEVFQREHGYAEPGGEYVRRFGTFNCRFEDEINAEIEAGSKFLGVHSIQVQKIGGTDTELLVHFQRPCGR
ncbi:MAG: hypothetical protein HYT87_12990 [Nitrospirae bacterium]|nr:hypothetical protein [Nitrospirota bacterium]